MTRKNRNARLRKNGFPAGFSSLIWIFFVSRRFARVDAKGRSAATSVLATLGIAFGVTALIVVMSIMNGFQMSFIDSILEISSYHLRVSLDGSDADADDFLRVCADDNRISYVTAFYEAQALMTGGYGGEGAVIIRAVDPLVYAQDEGFRKELAIIAGSFSLTDADSVVIGNALASSLDVGVGDEVYLLVMSGGQDVELFSEDRVLKVAGIYTSGYRDINSSYCFVNFQAADAYFGKDAKMVWGIKLKNYNHDASVCQSLRRAFPDADVSAWRDYNKSFYGVLRMEKNLLLLIVALIFVVVAINIYNGMRRLVFERQSEISVLSALGATKTEVKLIFIAKGLLMGVIGAISGLALGLLISYNTDIVFKAMSSVLYFFQYALTAVTNPGNLRYVRMNSSYSLYASIPARIFGGEVAGIALFGALSPFVAAWSASRNILRMSVAEVLHNE